jgi:hypothetical protein
LKGAKLLEGEADDVEVLEVVERKSPRRCAEGFWDVA